jgi:hypothetical protein
MDQTQCLLPCIYHYYDVFSVSSDDVSIKQYQAVGVAFTNKINAHNSTLDIMCVGIGRVRVRMYIVISISSETYKFTIAVFFLVISQQGNKTITS